MSPDYEIVFSADGNTIQRATASIPEGAFGQVRILTPWMTAGDHTIRVFVDNSYHARRLSVDQLEVLSAQGPDSNGNGTADWVEARIGRTNGFSPPSESITSPVCLEGRSRWHELTTVAGHPVLPAPNDHWYTNVPLSETQPTRIAASLENGALSLTRDVTWVPANLMAISTVSIRLGDSMKLSAFTGSSGTPEETVTVTVEGQSATFSADQSLAHTFQTAGEIPVEVTHVIDGNVTVKTVMVRVVSPPPIAEEPVCVVGFHRQVDLPALSAGVSCQLDDRIEIRESSLAAGGATSRILRLNTLQDRYAVLRLGGETGPILRSLPLRAMRVRDSSQTAVFVGGMLGTNQWDVCMPVVVDGNHAGTSIVYDIFIGGVVFEDGSLQRTLLPGASPAFHWDTLMHFYKTGLVGSNCHRASVWQAGRRIAFYQ